MNINDTDTSLQHMTVKADYSIDSNKMCQSLYKHCGLSWKMICGWVLWDLRVFRFSFLIGFFINLYKLDGIIGYRNMARD